MLRRYSENLVAYKVNTAPTCEHTPADPAGVVTVSTCTEGGYTTYTCSKCGEEYTGNKTEALGHTWGEATITTPATCTTDGVKTYTCMVCGETKTEAILKIAHTVVTDEAKAPTCTESGLTEGSHCSVCEAVIVAQETVAALGHNFVNSVCSTCCLKEGSASYSKQTITLQDGDKVVLAFEDLTLGVTGLGSSNAAVDTNKSNWKIYIISAVEGGYTLYDEDAKKFIAAPGGAEFKYSEIAGVFNFSDGVLVCNNRFLGKNGTNYRFYATSNNYTAFYVYTLSADKYSHSNITVSGSDLICGVCGANCGKVATVDPAPVTEIENVINPGIIVKGEETGNKLGYVSIIDNNKVFEEFTVKKTTVEGTTEEISLKPTITVFNKKEDGTIEETTEEYLGFAEYSTTVPFENVFAKVTLKNGKVAIIDNVVKRSDGTFVIPMMNDIDAVGSIELHENKNAEKAVQTKFTQLQSNGTQVRFFQSVSDELLGFGASEDNRIISSNISGLGYKLSIQYTTADGTATVESAEQKQSKVYKNFKFGTENDVISFNDSYFFVFRGEFSQFAELTDAHNQIIVTVTSWAIGNDGNRIGSESATSYTVTFNAAKTAIESISAIA